MGRSCLTFLQKTIPIILILNTQRFGVLVLGSSAIYLAVLGHVSGILQVQPTHLNHGVGYEQLLGHHINPPARCATIRVLWAA